MAVYRLHPTPCHSFVVRIKLKLACLLALTGAIAVPMSQAETASVTQIESIKHSAEVAVALSVLKHSNDAFEATHALLTLTENPRKTLENMMTLLDSLPEMQGELELALIPVGIWECDYSWNRAEVVLAWIAENLRNSSPGEGRTEARNHFLDYCVEATRGLNPSVSRAHGYECGYRSIFYGNQNLYVTPMGDMKKFLELLKSCANLEGAESVNAISNPSPPHYFTDDEELERKLRVTVDNFTRSTPDLWVEYEKILGVSRLVRDPHVGAEFGGSYYTYEVPVSESTIFSFRDVNSDSVLESFLPGCSSYAFAFGYVLAETRKAQAENIERILDLSDRGYFPLAWVVRPVFDISPEYEKGIVEKQIEFLRSRVFDQNSWKPDEPHFAKPVLNASATVDYFSRLLGAKSAGLKRSDIYGRKRVTEILVEMLSIDQGNDVSRRAAEVLLCAAQLDASTATIALEGAMSTLESLVSIQRDVPDGPGFGSSLEYVLGEVVEAANVTISLN